MAKGKSAAGRRVQGFKQLEFWTDPYLSTWMALTPYERLRRAWRMRSRIRNLQAVHDAKSLPKL